LPILVASRRCLAVAAALLAAGPSRAQAPPLRVEPVVVEATRVPGAGLDSPWPVTVVEGEVLTRARQGLGLDEALATVPGLYAQNRYNFAQDLRLSLRGFGANATFGIRGIRVLVDGVPATLPDGQTGVDAIDPAALERVEVIRGPAASLYGASTGGVISLATRRPPRAPEARVALSTGSYGFAEQRVSAGGGSPTAAGLVRLGHASIDGYRRLSAAERTLLDARADATLPGGGTLRLTLSAVDSPEAQDPGGLTAVQRARDRRQAGALNRRFRTGETVAQQRAGLLLRAPIAGGEAHTRLYGVSRDFDARLPFQTVSLDRTAGGGGAGFGRTDTVGGVPVSWHAGLDLDGQDDARRRNRNVAGASAALIADQDERVTALGVWLTGTARTSKRLELSAGLRGDRVEVEVEDRFLADGDQSGDVVFSALSPQVGAVYRASDVLDLYANASTAFETPTTAELANPSGGGGLNATLDAQHALSLEVGARKWLAGGRARAELALFHVRVEDQLVPVPIAGAPDRFAFRNAGRSRLLGLEASVEAEPVAGLDLRAAWTWSRFSYRRFTDAGGADLDGNRLPGIPRHLLALSAAWRPGAGWFLAGDVQAVSRRFADSANTATSPGYVLLDARVGYAWTRSDLTLEVYGGVNNVLDARYDGNLRVNAAGGRFFEPAPERNGYAGASAKLAF
jgi:iron complex outermembrane receptor protein